MQVLQLPELSNLSEYIQKHLDTYATEVLLTTNEIKFYVTQSWLAAYSSKVGQVPNMHLNSMLTGSVCISEKGTQISFADGRNDVFPGIDFPYTTIPFAFSTFEQGKLSLWPSKVPYTVQPNQGDTDQVVDGMVAALLTHVGLVVLVLVQVKELTLQILSPQYNNSLSGIQCSFNIACNCICCNSTWVGTVGEQCTYQHCKASRALYRWGVAGAWCRLKKRMRRMTDN